MLLDQSQVAPYLLTGSRLTRFAVPVTGTAFFILMFFLKLKTPKTPLVAGLRAIDWLGNILLFGTCSHVSLIFDFQAVLQSSAAR